MHPDSRFSASGIPLPTPMQPGTSLPVAEFVCKLGRLRTELEKRDSDKKNTCDKDSDSLPAEEVPLGESQERNVPASDVPPKPRSRHKIHKRRKVPRVKKGEVVKDPNPTPPADLDRR